MKNPSCEVVESSALNQKFFYCRFHKQETHSDGCPSATPENVSTWFSAPLPALDLDEQLRMSFEELTKELQQLEANGVL